MPRIADEMEHVKLSLLDDSIWKLENIQSSSETLPSGSLEQYDSHPKEFTQEQESVRDLNGSIKHTLEKTFAPSMEKDNDFIQLQRKPNLESLKKYVRKSKLDGIFVK